jgi:hypothetical protein
MREIKNNSKCLFKRNLRENVDEDNPDDGGDANSLEIERVDLANHWEAVQKVAYTAKKIRFMYSPKRTCARAQS